LVGWLEIYDAQRTTYGYKTIGNQDKYGDFHLTVNFLTGNLPAGLNRPGHDPLGALALEGFDLSAQADGAAEDGRRFRQRRRKKPVYFV
jgi:hypothetical protein